MFESRRGHGDPCGDPFYTRGRAARAGPEVGCGDREPELRRGPGPGTRCGVGAVGLGSLVCPTEGLGQAAAWGLVPLSTCKNVKAPQINLFSPKIIHKASKWLLHSNVS